MYYTSNAEWDIVILASTVPVRPRWLLLSDWCQQGYACVRLGCWWRQSQGLIVIVIAVWYVPYKLRGCSFYEFEVLMTIDNIFELFDLKHWTSGFATVYQKRGQHNVACLLCGGATIIRRQGRYLLSSWELHLNYSARDSSEAASLV